MPSGDVLRYIFLSLVTLVVIGIGVKWWSRGKEEQRLVAELRAHVNPTASFEQFYAAEAEKSLFRAMHHLRLGEDRLGTPPGELIDLAFAQESAGDPDGGHALDPRERLVRSALLRNYDNCRRLGVFDAAMSREALSKGTPPQVQAGPAAGESVRIRHIIDPAVSPGAEKIVPNLVISPPGPRSAPPNDFDIAQAKALAHDLQRAGLLEPEARDRIVNYYDTLPVPADPETEGEAEPEEAPAP